MRIKEIIKKIESVKDTCRIIKSETRPIEGHEDVGALSDCWNLINEELEEVKDYIIGKKNAK